MRRPHRRRSTIGVTGLLLAALMLGAAPVAAGSPPSPPPADTSSGKVGLFSITDSDDLPGATCSYGLTVDGTYYNFLTRIRARAPELFAHPSRRTQKVAWRLVIQVWSRETSTWTPYARSTWSSAVARPTTAAELTAKALRIRALRDRESYDSWRVKEELRWYARDGKAIVGRGSLWVDRYRSIEGEGAPWTRSERCGGTTG